MTSSSDEPKCPHKSRASNCPVSEENTLNNPLTNMPPAHILQEQQHSMSEEPHKVPLSTDRIASSIPRADTTSTWLYPSARMFYNALLRKGTPVDATSIPSMLAIHNHLNEQVWNEILSWESLNNASTPECQSPPMLRRFCGRPHDLSPRARFYTVFMNGQPPFDRHDWIVERCGREQRYIIDYYEIPGAKDDNEPLFSVDVRPAIDSPLALLTRMRMFWQRKISLIFKDNHPKSVEGFPK